jgi:hypothetical protein
MLRHIAALLLLATIPVAALSDAELDSIGRRVWKNECGGTLEGLTSWNTGEAFASLGIGHFIWYPKGGSGPFEESFPGLVKHLAASGVQTPEWLSGPCPWATRAEFLAAAKSPRMVELRGLLASTIRLQSRFLALRMERALPKLLAAAPAARREVIRARFEKLASSGAGTFALIDYVNFKGEGTNPRERYRGEGWGMLQVLDAMDADGAAAFGEAAARVLARRVENAKPKDESRWLAGWQARVRAYSAAR